MSTDDKALLIEGADGVEVALARNLLAEAGIPCVVHGPDFDVAELGRASHDMIRGQNVFVPASELERARALLEEAWGHGGSGTEQAESEP